MKRTDIAMIVFIASMSILVSYFVAKSILGDAANKPVTVKAAEPISKTIKEPDERIFHADAVNPTVEVFIGEGEQSSRAAQ
jgi:hypothetical protein